MSRDLDVSDPQLAASWKEVSEVKSDKNWVLFHIEANKLTVTGLGTGGYDELVSQLDPGKVHFGALKIVGKDVRKNVESLRNKFAFFTYIGDDVPVIQKAKVSVLRPFAEKIFTGYHVRFDVSTNLQNFSKQAIITELLRSGGAHTPTHYVFGPGDEIELNTAH
jgi:hypothetical protein